MNLSPTRWTSLFRRKPESPQDGHLVERALTAVRGADPDTSRAWARLATAMDSGAARVRPTARLNARTGIRPILVSTAGLAAIAVLLVVLRSHSDRNQVYATGRAQQTTIRLPDSTLVTLNHTSTVRMESFAGGHRVVRLEGEAYFQVSRTGSSFLVKTDAGEVEVLGTAFNVRARGGTTNLEVLHGKVRFGSGSEGKDSSVILTQDQKSQCVAGSPPTLPSAVPHRSSPGWMEGKILCEQRPLTDVCSELQDTYDIRIDFEDASLRNLTVTGTIEARSAHQALRALSMLTGHRYRSTHDSFIIY
jgi:ferric-dicitrate binding protein FerR (iron transport regulator)